MRFRVALFNIALSLFSEAGNPDLDPVPPYAVAQAANKVTATVSADPFASPMRLSFARILFVSPRIRPKQNES